MSTFESDVLSRTSKFGMISSLQFQKPEAKTLYLLQVCYNSSFLSSLLKRRLPFLNEKKLKFFAISRINKKLDFAFPYMFASQSNYLQRCLGFDSAEIFVTSQFSYLLISKPAHKTKIGTGNRWETTNSNPPGLIK